MNESATVRPEEPPSVGRRLEGRLPADVIDALAGAAPPGTFFDYACVHLIATSTLDHLQRAYPEGRFDVRRFRPNIVIRSQAEPFIEKDVVKPGTIRRGDTVHYLD